MSKILEKVRHVGMVLVVAPVIVPVILVLGAMLALGFDPHEDDDGHNDPY